MKRQRKQYTTEYKESLVGEYRVSGLSKASFAQKHKINLGTFSNWLTEDFKQRPEAEQELLRRIQELESELQEANWDREVLKKATAFFAKATR
jgi:transposase-like protein